VLYVQAHQKESLSLPAINDQKCFMLYSMTGYGRVQKPFQDKVIIAEVRSLNSKYSDLRLKIPQNYREKEGDLRRLLSDGTHRGKVDFSLEIRSNAGNEDYTLNVPLFKKYYQELAKLQQELEMGQPDFLQAILRLPNVVATNDQELNSEEWKAVQQVVKEILSKIQEFRATEGAVIETDMIKRVELIEEGLSQLPEFEAQRTEKMRQRIYQNLEDYLSKDNIDENRFEQEVLYYLEKMDITEEKVRLAQHCKYYKEVLANKKDQKGRKLSFIAQEMGREINTLGAKAYSSDIQKIVVSMKDELEKIKEQVANSL
jgi:uncharacterized protein (TIGR00255 family)